MLVGSCFSLFTDRPPTMPACRTHRPCRHPTCVSETGTWESSVWTSVSGCKAVGLTYCRETDAATCGGRPVVWTYSNTIVTHHEWKHLIKTTEAKQETIKQVKW